MGLEKSSLYLPDDPRPLMAFERTTDFYRNQSGNQPIENPGELLRNTISDYLLAGVAHLARRGHDAHLREVGSAMWHMLEQRRITLVLAEDMAATAIGYGMPSESAEAIFKNNNEPYVLASIAKKGKVEQETGYIFFHPSFIFRAMKQPIEALATIASLSSQVGDLANGRLQIDPDNIPHRSLATEAHFLHYAAAQHPEVELASEYREIMQAYPNGIHSLSRDMLYVSADQSVQTHEQDLLS